MLAATLLHCLYLFNQDIKCVQFMLLLFKNNPGLNTVEYKSLHSPKTKKADNLV